jgi:uncharacterized protein YjcR
MQPFATHGRNKPYNKRGKLIRSYKVTKTVNKHGEVVGNAPTTNREALDKGKQKRVLYMPHFKTVVGKI